MIILSTANKDYELKLSTLSTIKLEKKLKENPLNVFMKMSNNQLPELETIADILLYALQSKNPEVKTNNDVYRIIDEYVDNGGNFVGLVTLVTEVFQDSGLVPKEAPKNA